MAFSAPTRTADASSGFISIIVGRHWHAVNLKESAAKTIQWRWRDPIVKDNHVTVKIEGKPVVEYDQPADKQPGKDFSRKLDEGTFTLQAHDLAGVVRCKNLRVEPLD